VISVFLREKMTLACLQAAVIPGCLVLVLGCSNPVDHEGVTAPVDNSVMALAVGNVWTYERTWRETWLDEATIDTVTVRIRSAYYIDREWWYSVTGAISDELWSNRSDGLWVWPKSEEPYLLFRYPMSDIWEWTTPDGRYTINWRPYVSMYSEVSQQGGFWSEWYDVQPTPGPGEGVTCFFAPGLGITQSAILVPGDVVSPAFLREQLRLIDFDLADPPVDSTGYLTFFYYLPIGWLTPPYIYTVHIDLDEKPRGSLDYHFAPPELPAVPVGGYCALEVRSVPDSLRYTHRVMVRHVPAGVRSVGFRLMRGGTLDTLALIRIDSVTIPVRDTTDLGTIIGFDY